MPDLRLVLVPRQKDRFDEVAPLLDGQRPAVRPPQRINGVADRDAIVLVDTIGELGALWGLADVAFVGGSLDGQRGGQNMIEPAAYGAAVVFGPHVWNFKDTVARDPEDFVPDRDVDVHGRTDPRVPAGDVEDDVDATEALVEQRERPSDRVVVARVDGDAFGPSAGRPDDRNGRLDRVAVDVCDQDRGAAGRERRAAARPRQRSGRKTTRPSSWNGSPDLGLACITDLRDTSHRGLSPHGSPAGHRWVQVSG